MILKVGRHTIGIMLKDFHFFMKRLDKSYINCVRVCVSERERERIREREAQKIQFPNPIYYGWLIFRFICGWVKLVTSESEGG